MSEEFWKNRTRTNRVVRWMLAFTLVLFIFFLYQINRYIYSSMREYLYNEASTQLTMLGEFQRYYADKVIRKIDISDEMTTSHVHANHDGVIPIPVTMARELGEILSRLNNGNVSFDAVSRHPFPWRSERTMSAFENDALEYFESGGRDRFVRYSESGESNVYRMAVPLIMGESCVRCHNSYDKSPKVDWKVGDLRGAQLVEIQYANWLNLSNSGFANMVITLFIMVVCVGVVVNILSKRSRIAIREASKLAQEEQYRNAQLTEANQRIRESERLIKTIYNTVLECIITIDERGIVQTVNPSTERILGYRQEELIGENVSKIVDSRHAVHHDEYLRNYLETDIPKIIGIEREGQAVCKDGSTIDIMLSVNESRLGDRRIFVGSISDISQRVQYERELIEAVEKSKKASEAKSRFLAVMSHEIRTPLNAIINLNELVMEMDLNEEQYKLVKTARDSGKALSEIVNDILDFSRVEAGELILSPRAMEVEALVMAVSSLLKPTAIAKGLEFTYEIDADLPLNILADESRLRQIIVNLVGNAIKFTDEGWVILRIIRKPQSNARIPIRFEVEDSGAGISDEDKERLFTEFTQLEKSGKSSRGTGLGLAICKRLCVLMGGTISVSDTPSGGSLFYFEIEFQPADEVEDPADGEQLVKRLSKLVKRILVVEDSLPNQIVMRNILEIEGYAFDIAANGKIAVDMALDNEYDIVLMDVSMPVMDGYEATKELRAQGYEKPIIALSAYAFSDDVERSFEHGMNGYIRKPIDRDSLFKEIARIYSQHENNQISEVNALVEYLLRSSKDMKPDLFEAVFSRRLQRLQHAVDGLSNAAKLQQKQSIAKQCALLSDEAYLGRIQSILLACQFITGSIDRDDDIINEKISELIKDARQIIGELSARRNYVVGRFRELYGE